MKARPISTQSACAPETIARGILSNAFLKLVQIGNGALRLSGGLNDEALVVFQHREP
jgi:hypothetical protein